MTRLTPYIAVRGAAEAIAFYEKVFDAKERSRIPMGDGRIGHAEVAIGESVVYVSDEFAEMGVVGPQTHEGHDFSLVLEVDDPHAVFARAVAAGATEERPMEDQPFGRTGWFIDPFGVRWSVMRSNPAFDGSRAG